MLGQATGQQGMTTAGPPLKHTWDATRAKTPATTPEPQPPSLTAPAPAALLSAAACLTCAACLTGGAACQTHSHARSTPPSAAHTAPPCTAALPRGRERVPAAPCPSQTSLHPSHPHAQTCGGCHPPRVALPLAAAAAAHHPCPQQPVSTHMGRMHGAHFDT